MSHDAARAPRGLPAAAALTVAACAVVVAGAAWLPLADVRWSSLESGRELARADVRFAPDAGGWPWLMAGCGLVAALGLVLAARGIATRATTVILVGGWLVFLLAGLTMLDTAPAGSRPAAGGCQGLPSEPAEYWGEESWRQIEPSYEAAAARESDSGGPCWVVDDGPALPITILAGLVGTAATGVGAARVRGPSRPSRASLVAFVVALPAAVVWFFAWLLRALGTLE